MASQINQTATEEVDYLENGTARPALSGKSKQGSLVKEMTGFTPLMLAVASGDHNLDCVKLLLGAKADYNICDSKKNGLLHIAAIYQRNKILEYLLKNLQIDIFARNKAGDTALTICESSNNSKGVELFKELESQYDKSGNTAQSLLNELENEEEQSEAQQRKRKEKKWRNKINKLAKQLNLTPEEVEEKLRKEEEERARKEEQERLDAIRREKEEEIAEQKRREEIRRENERLRAQQAAEEEAERRREREAARQRAAEEAEQRRLTQEAQKQIRLEKQARERERERKQREQQAAKADLRKPKESGAQERHDGMVTPGGPGEPAQLSKESKPYTPRGDKPSARERTPVNRDRKQGGQSQRRGEASKSRDRREEGANMLSNEEPVQQSGIQGLSGEMALNAGISKKSQQRLKKKLEQ